MPYVTKERRKELYPEITAENAGELNYKITMEILDYLDSGDKRDYKAYNEIMGVLECIKQELYRRMIAPYEDKKKEEHGDVF